MGYNADLFTREPIQFDVLQLENKKHFFVRDKDKRWWPCKSYAWPNILPPNGIYLAEMHHLPGGTNTTNYKVKALRRLNCSLGEAKQVNEELYELMLQRDEANVKFSDDHIFMDVQRWVRHQVPVSKAPERLSDIHSKLMSIYTSTGVPNPALEFLATRKDVTFSDLRLAQV